jgi:hypothetical protein
MLAVYMKKDSIDMKAINAKAAARIKAFGGTGGSAA